MNFIVATHTDVGIKKQTNQDALLVKVARTPEGRVALCLVCDGMGGLAKGELASSTAVREMSKWFETSLPDLLDKSDIEKEICANFNKVVATVNEKIAAYGKANGVQLGTTFTAFLLIYDQFFIAQIGDSRVYSINSSLNKLTKDQTVVAREVERGNMTEEQAKKDPRRNVLLQCLGATKDVQVAFSKGQAETGTVFILCSDGFYHEISNEELFEQLKPEKLIDENQMKATAIDLIELVKSRKETDNISVILLKAV